MTVQSGVEVNGSHCCVYSYCDVVVGSILFPCSTREHQTCSGSKCNRCVESFTKYVSLYHNIMLIISAELHNIRRDFDAYKKDPPLHSQFPLYAGKAMWARGLAQRIKQQFDLLESAKYITPVKEAEEARIDYNELKQALDGYVQRYYREWIASLQDANLYVIFMSFCSCFF